MNNKKTETILQKINQIKAPDRRVIAAVDGRCASGKTTLANELQIRTECTVFHMDDYFLRPEQRTENRLNTPGGNVDRERFLEEILIPLSNGEKEITYRKFDCETMTLKPPVTVIPKDVVIVEGAYSCHPELSGFYDIRIFLSVSREEQIKRLKQRNKEQDVKTFLEKWIPMEEAYFEEFDIEKTCDLKF
jgi:uridine kinase